MLMIFIIGLMTEGKMSLSKVMGIWSISQLFETICFMTVATSYSVIGMRLLSFDALWCGGEKLL